LTDEFHRLTLAGAGLGAQEIRPCSAGSGSTEQIAIRIGSLRFTGIASVIGGLLYLEFFPLLPL